MNRFLTVLMILLSSVALDAAGPKVKKVNGVIRPPYLMPGDSIGILTVSSPVETRRSKADSLIALVESWGLKVRLSENLYKRENGAFNVSDKERGEEMQRMIENDNLKAIIFFRGGYGAIRTVDYVDFTYLKKHPKWIVGFSDLTTYLSILSNLDIESIHGGMLTSYSLTNPDDVDTKTARAALFGELKSYQTEPNAYNRCGEVEGRLVGGNMSLMSMAIGTPYDLEIDDNTILFIEEVDEKLATIDRFMQQLLRSGKLDKIKGLIIGNFTRPKDEDYWGMKAYDMLSFYTKDMNIPVLYGLKSGHGKINNALYMGGKIKLTVTENGGTVEFKN